MIQAIISNQSDNTLRHVSRLQGGDDHPTPKNLDDLNAELASIDMGHIEFMKYEEEEDPHLEAFLADSNNDN